MEFLPQSLNGWKDVQQFVLYKITASKTRAGKTDKLPINAYGQTCDAQDPSNWLSFETAAQRLKTYGAGYGIGFVFTKKDPYFFVDIDGCLDANNQWSKLSTELCTMFNGAAIEISASGKGLHIFGRSSPLLHACKNTLENIELYTSGRFVALTGYSAMGDVETDHSHALQTVINKYFNPTTTNDIPSVWTNEPVGQWRGPDDDKVLIDRMIRSTSANAVFAGGASFADLWNANVEVLSKAYPDQYAERQYDESSADAALAQHLAYWTGNNCERMKQLMFQSGLCRDKWEREDYIQRTILNACALKKEWLHDKPPQELSTTQEKQTPLMVKGKTLLGIDDQLKLFEGCVYVQDEHKILTPGGILLKEKQFKATYGGYSFIMDNNNERVIRNAWECFTESQAVRFPRVNTTCFKPLLAPGEIIKKDKLTAVNIHYPIDRPRLEGDPTPFLNHLYRLLPDNRDALIFLSYMAACVQYQGVKFKWAPVIQGVEGNGKSLFSVCVAEAIGYRYCHLPNADNLGEKYNDWEYKNVFIGIEDMAEFKYGHDIVEKMKPMITGEHREIRSMGTDKVMREVCANYIISTNHKDGMRKTTNDRRYSHFFTAQQYKEDLERDGLNGDYFPKLFNWFEHENGYAIVAYFLENFKIPDEFNPSFKKPAPVTSSTQEAIESSMGYIEQEILEAIAQEIPCFRNGWISSTGLEHLLEKLKAARTIPPNKRRDLMRSLGYDYHPALPKGRVNTIVLPDGNRPRLYVQTKSDKVRLATPSEVVETYIKDQTQ